ncbi:hypothetical protein BaRGS_00019041 [Batillaria attramentaria]|uniref:Uncharacterized protein n=1 Tax=Batillaria attramentaria TaxID=370345 RepID=A0ABD0KRB3_9CAEN
MQKGRDKISSLMHIPGQVQERRNVKYGRRRWGENQVYSVRGSVISTQLPNNTHDTCKPRHPVDPSVCSPVIHWRNSHCTVDRQAAGG